MYIRLGMTPIPMPDSSTVLRLQDEATERWHDPAAPRGDMQDESLPGLILAQHRANFDLWHEEDEARDPIASDKRIAEVKRAIDRLNQRRNDLVERIDSTWIEQVRQAPDAPLHSETPAMIVDRLSIMGLKVYHTRVEMLRETAAREHRARNASRLKLLEEQRSDLAECLDLLLQQIVRGERRFKIYRQMKMYNDPELNPVLYRGGS